MKRKKTGLKSLDGIDLAIAIKNSGQEGVNIECSYKGDLRYVVDADYGCSSRQIQTTALFEIGGIQKQLIYLQHG